jgi:hypothetical protein
MNHLLRPPIWPSFLASSGVGSCDVPFRYASGSISDFGFRISDFRLQQMIWNSTVQISSFAFSLSKTFTQIFNPHSAIRIPQSSIRWHAHLHGLATAIHETSGLGKSETKNSTDLHEQEECQRVLRFFPAFPIEASHARIIRTFGSYYVLKY